MRHQSVGRFGRDSVGFANMAIETETTDWAIGELGFGGHVAYPENSAGKLRPAVLVFHAWAGQGDFERTRASELARLGYIGVAVDVYGKGKRGTNPGECSALMSPLVEDRELLRTRVVASLEAVCALPRVDSSAVAAIGFCFGGMCVLDLARSGADVAAVVSFHGLLGPSGLEPQPIGSKVLVLHGFDDPMAKPEALVALGHELTSAGADWQAVAYGQTMHAFTNPAAANPSFGIVYNPVAERRSLAAMESMLAESLTAK